MFVIGRRVFCLCVDGCVCLSMGKQLMCLFESMWVLLFVVQCLLVVFLVVMMPVSVCKWASFSFTLMYNSLYHYVYNCIWLYHLVYTILSKSRYNVCILLDDDIHCYVCINIYSYMIIVVLYVCMSCNYYWHVYLLIYVLCMYAID